MLWKKVVRKSKRLLHAGSCLIHAFYNSEHGNWRAVRWDCPCGGSFKALCHFHPWSRRQHAPGQSSWCRELQCIHARYMRLHFSSGLLALATRWAARISLLRTLIRSGYHGVDTAGILLFGRITDTNHNERERLYNGSEMKTSPSSYNSVFMQSVAFSLSLTSTVVCAVASFSTFL